VEILTVELNLESALEHTENIQFLLSMSHRRYDCLLRAAEALQQKVVKGLVQ